MPMRTSQKGTLRLLQSEPTLCRLRDERRKGPMVFLRKLFGYSVQALAAIFLSAATSFAYTVIQVSTASTPGLETSFIQATTSQFTASVFVNPLFANTYQILLYGYNPGYVKPVSNKDLLDALVTVDSFTYVYGWADGEAYQQHADNLLTEQFEVNCSTPFGISTSTWNTATCLSVTGAIDEAIFQESLSTPTFIPGGF